MPPLGLFVARGSSSKSTQASKRRKIAASPKQITRDTISSPTRLCIYDEAYREATLKFLSQISISIFEDLQYVVLDLEPLEEVTAGAALMLFSHVTRAQNSASQNIFQFRDQIVQLSFGENREGYEFFRDCGLLDALRPGGRKKLEGLWGALDQPFKTHNQPQTLYLEVTRWLRSYYGDLPKRMSAAIQESLLNVTHHSYAKFKNSENPLDPFMVNRWWQYAQIIEDTETKKLVFMIFDLGSGIPETAATVARSKRDSDIIAEAMTQGFSSTGLPGRGNGSADILKPISLADTEDSLFIASGRGHVEYRHGKVDTATDYDLPSVGTLLEWTFVTHRGL